jgi:peptide/nickel transport system permease protein
MTTGETDHVALLAAGGEAALGPRGRLSSLRSRALASPRTLVGASIFGVIVLLSVLAPIIAPHDPLAMDIDHALQAPSLEHLFGTDDFGRDTFSRVLYGGRPTLAIASVTVLLSMLVGVPAGILAGYVGGRVDLFLMRVVELGFALPALILAIGIIALLGTGARNVVIALAIVFMPIFARVSRASTIEVSHRPFILAARAVGDRDSAIMVRQVAPNIAAPVLVQAALAFAYAILAEASLSFLGLGTQPPLPSWGRMLTDAIPLIQVAPWLGIFPGLFIVLTVASLNLIGDGARDLLDPALAKASRQ